MIYRPLHRSLFLIEMLIMFSLAAAAFVVRFQFSAWNLFNYPNLVPKIFLAVVVTQLCLYYNNLYQFSHLKRTRELALSILQAVGAAMLVLLGIYYAIPSMLIGRGVFAMMMTMFFMIAFGWRCLLHRLSSSGRLSKRILILGNGKAAISVANYLSDPEQRFTNDLVGFMEEDFRHLTALGSTGHVLGSYQNFVETVLHEQIELIVVALDDRRGQLPLDALAECKLHGVEVVDAVKFWEVEESMISITDLKPSWLIFSDGFRQSRVSLLIKEILEMVVAVVLLVLTGPIMIAVAIAIRFDSPGPIFYRQVRVGVRGKVFTLFKFRSMRQDAESDGTARWAEENDPRITRLGRILRTYRLDELPQLLNVIRGEMSLVGPRPERPQFVNQLLHEIPCYSQRLAVKPGVTGLAQVRMKYGASVGDSMKKLEYDLYYVKNLSVLLDVSILIDTFKVVLLGKGAR